MSGNYTQYPYPKGYCPLGWIETTVSKITLEIRSGFSSGLHNERGEGIPHLRPMNVSAIGEIALDDIRYVSSDSGAARLSDNDILFTNTSSTAWVGKTALVRIPKDWAFSNHMTRLKAAPGVDPEFVARQLHYLCMCRYFAFHCKKHINQSSISTKQLADEVPFRLPPSDEQKRIISELNGLLRKEKLIRETLESLPIIIRDYRSAVLESACEGILVPQEAELSKGSDVPLESATTFLNRIIASKRLSGESNSKVRAGTANAKRSVYNKSPDQSHSALPVAWCWTNLGQIKTFSLYGPRFSARDYTDKGIPILRTTDIDSSGKVDVDNAPKLKLDKSKLETYKLKRGDLLITRTGSLGTVAVFNDSIDAIPGAYLIHYRLAAPLITSWYIFYFLRSPLGQSYLLGKGAGVGRQNLNVPSLDSIQIPLPPLSEQSRIVAEIDKQLKAMSNVESIIEKSIRETIQLRGAIFKKAFSGGLVPQSSSDASAQSLLNEITRHKAVVAKLPKPKRVQKPRKQNEGMPMLTIDDIEPTHLADILRDNKSKLDAKSLWKQSGLSIDDFYAQLKSELGTTIEETGQERLLRAKP